MDRRDCHQHSCTHRRARGERGGDEHDAHGREDLREQRLHDGLLALLLDLANGVLLDRLSITEIAYRWAFADPAQFSRAFRQAYGESPGSFRKSACAGRF